MPTCPNGHSVAAGNVFCNQCGATIARSGAETVRRPVPAADETVVRPMPDQTMPGSEPTQGVVSRASTDAPPPFNPVQPPILPPPLAMGGGYEPPEPRRNTNVLAYSIAGLVILLAIGAVVAVLLLKGGSKNSGQNTNNPLTNPTLSATPSASNTPSSSTVVVSDGCGDAASPKPGQFQLQCSNPGASLGNLTWTSWNAQGASGNGTYYTPTGTGENTTSVPVLVEMAQPVAGASGLEFSQIIVTPTSAGSTVTWVQSTPDGTWTNSSSMQSRGPMPAGGALCPGLIQGKYQFGTLGTETSCGFVRAVYKAWESSGNQSPVTATSPATHETYNNIVCTVDSTQSWATCVGGRNNTAHMFFALP